jgi:hypothetical protein
VFVIVLMLTVPKFATAVFVILGCVAVGALVWWVAWCLAHLRPLTADEVSRLATKRRDKAIRKYYDFALQELAPDMPFKKRMNATGVLYTLQEPLPLRTFPCYVAALLKGKKHEWAVLAFESDRSVTKMWVVKGPDNSRVFYTLGEEDILRIAREERSHTVLAFHNHPNPNPSQWAMHMPSETDKRTHASYGSTLTVRGVNHLAFVCERGLPYEFHRSVADGFYPISDFTEKIERNNGTGKGINLTLHRELAFGKV